MNRAVGLGLVFSSLVLAAGVLTPAACDSSPPAKGSGGTAGTGAGGGVSGGAGAGGQAGMTGEAGGAGGGAPLAFMAVNPCNTADAYLTAGDTIAYGGPDLTFSPKCLKVAAGGQVTFVPATSSDDFSMHPLNHSLRGTLPSPITETLTGATTTFTFTTPGFYAYYCEFHGSADDGNFMAGVIWVE